MSKKPSHEAFVVEDGREDGDRSFWTKIGAAWPTNDGKGLTLTIVSGVSVSGRIVLLPKDDKKSSK